ncbi:MAG: hypothetical protein ACYSWQ_08155, partial [Planctomycetota bacterium]
MVRAQSMERTPQRLVIVALIGLTATGASSANAVPIETQLGRCPPIVFIKRPAQGRKGTNGTMLGQRTKIGSAICTYDP